jgi:alpha-ribazole phosphatase
VDRISKFEDMIISAIRHTSVKVPSGICYGGTDVPLAETFGNEALAISRQIENQKFDSVYSSPMKRCTLLSSEIFPGFLPLVDKRLAELDFGHWEMQSWETIFNSREGKTWFENYTQASCPNGESFAGLISRVRLFLNDLKTKNNIRVALVTHAGVIRALMCLLWQKTPEETFHTPLKYGEIVNFNFNS